MRFVQLPAPPRATGEPARSGTPGADRSRGAQFHDVPLSWRRGRDLIPYILGLLALVVYLPAIWWGLPYATSPLAVHGWDVDAVTGVQTLSELHNLLVAAKPDWWVAYPPFHYLVLGLVYAPYLALLVATSRLSNPSAEFPYGLKDPVATLATLELIGRLVTVAMAVGLIVVVYLSAKEIWDRRTGILAAGAILLATPMFYYARTGNLDVPVLFWTSVGILVIARILRRGWSVRRGILLGTLVALSVATKDQAYGAWIAALIVLGVTALRHGTAVQRRAFLGTVLSGSLVYALASGLLLSPRRFFAHAGFLLHFEQTFPNVAHANILRPMTVSGYSLLSLDIAEALLLAIGPVFVAVGLVGVCFTRDPTRFTRVLIAMGLGHVFLVIWPIRHMQYRYTLLLALIFAFFVARATVLGLGSSPATRDLVLFAVVAGCGWLVARGTDLTYQMLFDARNSAGEWLASECHQGDQIAFFGATPNTVPALPSGIVALGLPDDASAVGALKADRSQFVLATHGSFNDVGLERTAFVPPSIWKGLEDGSLGYRRLAEFATPPLLGGPFADVPLTSLGYLVNPTLDIYGLSSGSPTAPGRQGAVEVGRCPPRASQAGAET